jgi:Flp pilus assembly protein TadG
VGRRGRRGAGASEFAVLSMVLAFIMLATVDLMMFMRAQVKLEAAAVQVGQIVSQCAIITNPGDVNDFWRLATTALGGVADVTATSASSVIISGVTLSGTANRVSWQLKSKASATSAIGSAGGTATIPGGYIVPAGQLLIVTEVASPTQLWVMSRLLLGLGLVQATLNTRTLYLARTPDTTTMISGPTNSSTKQCMA